MHGGFKKGYRPFRNRVLRIGCILDQHHAKISCFGGSVILSSCIDISWWIFVELHHHLVIWCQLSPLIIYCRRCWHNYLKSTSTFSTFNSKFQDTNACVFKDRIFVFGGLLRGALRRVQIGRRPWVAPTVRAWAGPNKPKGITGWVMTNSLVEGSQMNQASTVVLLYWLFICQ